MSGVQHTQLPAGLGICPQSDASGPFVSKPYQRQFIVRLPIVASASAQAIAYTSIKGWPTRYARVMHTAINVVSAPATGTTKTVSLGYAGSTTTFVNAQSAASAGVIPGSGAQVDLHATNLSYTLGSNNWDTTAVLEAILLVDCID
jgi:hypothetical protein